MEEAAFQEGDSVLHRTDPRLKLVLSLALAFGMAGLSTLTGAAAALFLGVLLAAGARLSFKGLLRRLALVNGLIAFLWIMLPFSAPGGELFKLGPLSATLEGIQLAGLITLKCNAILLCIMSLAATIPTSDMGQALASLRVPDKFTLMFILCFRYLHLIREEYGRLAAAARIRCFRPGTNLHTYRTYGYLLGMLLVGSYERGKRVYQAMCLRGFQGRFYSLHRFTFRARDGWTALAIAVPALGLALVEIYARGHFALPG